MRNGQNNNKRMRNRSNNNNNNNRRGQNPLTRVFESNGPDIKIRGTASHIAEKYVQLARDARSSGDPVAAENYYQHAEHYFRLIAAAQEQFRQNQPQPRIENDMAADDSDEDGESFSNFGQEPGFVPSQPQPFQRDPQRDHNRDHQREGQPYQRDHNREHRGQSQPFLIMAVLIACPLSSRVDSRKLMAVRAVSTTMAVNVSASGIRAAAAGRMARARKASPRRPDRAMISRRVTNRIGRSAGRHDSRS